MRVVIVGLGIQGYKRRKVAGADYVAAVDLVNPEADYRSIEEVPLDTYDAALCCIPDHPKIAVITYLMQNKKHVLVEKPLWASSEIEITALQTLARKQNVVCYTAYNHRFEPHFVRVRTALQSGELGKLYRCRMFYGNGTARLVRDSEWRDHGSGVLHDLGSHLLDTAKYWFGSVGDNFSVISCNRFENSAPDHIVFGNELITPKLEFEATLLSWRNHFTCDIFAENGSLHIESLCKWGPTRFIWRKRVLPSGYPNEEVLELEQSDPTWESEYNYFKTLCENSVATDLSTDVWLNKTLRNIGAEALAKASMK